MIRVESIQSEVYSAGKCTDGLSVELEREQDLLLHNLDSFADPSDQDVGLGAHDCGGTVGTAALVRSDPRVVPVCVKFERSCFDLLLP